MADSTKKAHNPGMGQPTAAATDRHNPKKGEHYRCGQCGMEIEVSKDCHCKNPNEAVHFACCGKELQRA